MLRVTTEVEAGGVLDFVGRGERILLGVAVEGSGRQGVLGLRVRTANECEEGAEEEGEVF